MKPEIQEIIDEQDWDDQSVLAILWAYVMAQGHDDAVLDHFLNAAAAEDEDLGMEGDGRTAAERAEEEEYLKNRPTPGPADGTD